MFKKVQDHIENAELAKASKILRSMTKLEQLSTQNLLAYFQLCRRVGDFHYGAVQLEKMEELFPALEIEKAFYLGELGAPRQAVRLLSMHVGALPPEVEVQRYLQRGNFLSLLHEYDDAIISYQQMENHARDFNPTLALVARLNVLGHRVYACKELQETILQLQDFAEKLKPYPLMQQGAFYFLSLASQQLGKIVEAKLFLGKAQSLGVEHRLRESLLLKLTQLELSPEDLSSSSLTPLKKIIYGQNHIVYLDQLHKIQALHCESQGDNEGALRFYQKVLFGGRKHSHYDFAWRRYQALSGESSLVGWQLERKNPVVLTKHQVIYNQLERRQWPLLVHGKKEASLLEESSLLANLTLHLARNLAFPLRDAEVWENIWDVPFSFLSSPTVIRTCLTRWRKTPFAGFAEVTQKDHRILFEMKAGAKLLVPAQN